MERLERFYLSLEEAREELDLVRLALDERMWHAVINAANSAASILLELAEEVQIDE